MAAINEHLTRAFRLAHRASEDDIFGQAARNIFREVALEIWKAHGEVANGREMPGRLWTYIGRASADTHKYFREESTGKIALADLSATYPHQTDDGILYVDFSKGISCDDGGHTLAVTKENGESYHTMLTIKERDWLLAQFPQLRGQQHG